MDNAVLIMEYHPDALKITKAAVAIACEGIRIISVKNTQEAKEVFDNLCKKKIRIILIVGDGTGSSMTREDFVEYVHQRSSTAGLDVSKPIIVAMNDVYPEKWMIPESGVQFFVAKPYIYQGIQKVIPQICKEDVNGSGRS